MRNSHEEEVRLANNMEEIKPAKQCSSIRCWSKIFYACFWLSLLNSALQGLMSLLKSALQGLNLPYCNLLHVQAFPVPPSGLSALLIIWFCSCSSFHFQVSRMKIARNAYARDPREDGKSIRHPVSRVVWTNNKVDELWFIQLLVGPSKHCRQHAGKAFSSFIQIFAVFSFRKWKCWCFLSGNARLCRTRVGRWRIQCWQSEMWTFTVLRHGPHNDLPWRSKSRHFSFVVSRMVGSSLLLRSHHYIERHQYYFGAASVLNRVIQQNESHRCWTKQF